MAQILLIGSLGLGMAGALSAEENEAVEVSEIAVHQSEVDRVLSSPISGNWDLDQEDFFVTKKNRISLFSKQKSSQNKIQESAMSSFSDSHSESLNPNFKDCVLSSFAAGSHFYLNSFFSPAFRILDFNSALFLEAADSNSPVKNESWNQNKSVVLPGAGCFLSARSETGKNFCASLDQFFLSTIDLEFGRNFAPSFGFYPGHRIQEGVALDFLSGGFRNGRVVLGIAMDDSARDVGAEERVGRFSESSRLNGEKNQASLPARNSFQNPVEMSQSFHRQKVAFLIEREVGTPKTSALHSSYKRQGASSILGKVLLDRLVG